MAAVDLWSSSLVDQRFDRRRAVGSSTCAARAVAVVGRAARGQTEVNVQVSRAVKKRSKSGHHLPRSRKGFDWTHAQAVKSRFDRQKGFLTTGPLGRKRDEA